MTGIRKNSGSCPPKSSFGRRDEGEGGNVAPFAKGGPGDLNVRFHHTIQNYRIGILFFRLLCVVCKNKYKGGVKPLRQSFPSRKAKGGNYG